MKLGETDTKMKNLRYLLEKNTLSHLTFMDLFKELISEMAFWHFLQSRILQTLSHGGDVL